MDLPREISDTIRRDARLMEIRDRIRGREQHEASSYKAPVFSTWQRVWHYEQWFPGSTVAEGSVVFEP